MPPAGGREGIPQEGSALEIFGIVLAQAVLVFLYVMMIGTFVRAIMGWFPISEDSPVIAFVTKLTDIIVIPVRNVIGKIEYFDSMPFDLSVFFSMMVLMILTLVLGGI